MNEVPKKIYLEREIETDRIHHLWSKTPVISSLYEHIEYIRTDIVVEKACDAYCKACKMPNCRRTECKWLSDFKGYLENI